MENTVDYLLVFTVGDVKEKESYSLAPTEIEDLGEFYVVYTSAEKAQLTLRFIQAFVDGHANRGWLLPDDDMPQDLWDNLFHTRLNTNKGYPQNPVIKDGSFQIIERAVTYSQVFWQDKV